MEWISSIQRGAGRYPILCRVEQELVEFPYDRESQSEIRKHTYESNRAKSGSGSGGTLVEKTLEVEVGSNRVSLIQEDEKNRVATNLPWPWW